MRPAASRISACRRKERADERLQPQAIVAAETPARSRRRNLRARSQCPGGSWHAAAVATGARIPRARVAGGLRMSDRMRRVSLIHLIGIGGAGMGGIAE